MKFLKNILRVVKSFIFSFKYLKNPLVIFKFLFNKKIIIILKNNENIEVSIKTFVHYIELFQRKYYYEKGFLMKKNIIYKTEKIDVLLENFYKMYNVTNIKDKNILDIGGFQGETALFFISEMKANNIFVYEPVKENIKYIKENIKLNKLENNIFLYEKGVSNKDGIEKITSCSEPGKTAFGMHGDKYSLEISVESWNTILKKHQKDDIYLAKVDCEGGEKYLIDANKELIKTISNWVIETHSKEIEENIIELFKNLGYNRKLKDGSKDATVKVWYFYI